MLRIRIVLFCLLATGASAQAQTNFYQCQDQWGQPVFSQKPCGEDAEQRSIDGPRQSASGEHDEGVWEKVSASNVIRDAERDLVMRKGRVASLEAERDRKIATLRNKKRNASNNLAGAIWEESISSEIQAVNKWYQSKIDSELRKIDRIRDQIDRTQEAL